eukprot:1194967-Prorocentrum_minimum.AAC.8
MGGFLWSRANQEPRFRYRIRKCVRKCVEPSDCKNQIGVKVNCEPSVCGHLWARPYMGLLLYRRSEKNVKSFVKVYTTFTYRHCKEIDTTHLSTLAYSCTRRRPSPPFDYPYYRR